jgi:hypothetical protein
VDVDGNLLFYNEPAECILGRRFAETGELTSAEWATAFGPMDDQGRSLPPEELPLLIALRRRQPAQATFWIRGLDHVRRRIQVVAFPLVGQRDRFLGGVAIFWEEPAP